MDDLLPEFLSETAENLQIVANELVRFERDPSDAEVLANIFRLVHTVKGSCGFIALPRLERVAHAAETLLGKLRDGELQANAAIVTETLAAIDTIRQITHSIGVDGKEPEGDDGKLIERLDRLSRGETLCAPNPEATGNAGDIGASRDEGSMANQSIRVSVTLLEELMTSVSELVLTRNQLIQERRATGSTDLDLPLQRLSAQISRLQDSVMRTRMQPISGAWNLLPRIVRQLSVDLGKEIDLELEGGDTELDRQMLELIKDPLAHMVRNAADHGLEAPADRSAQGKSPRGTIRLTAVQEGGHITLTLSDDGRGLNFGRLREKAVERGQMSPAEAAAATEAQLARLIFAPGMSTAAEITQISGRGVGMDVVRANIERMSGTIEVDSSPGKGTRFSIRVPLTLAIMPALIVGVGEARFAVPQMAVAELVRTGDHGGHRIEMAGPVPVLRLRGRLLPLLHLGEVLQTGGTDSDHVLVIRGGGTQFGILVDTIFDTEELVIKPVSRPLSALGVYSGNAILGDGEVIMILDVTGLAEHLGDSAIEEPEEDEEEACEAALAKDAMLVFRAGGQPHPRAVPLALVSRIEDIEHDRIERSGRDHVVQLRESLVRLVDMAAPYAPPDGGRQTALVFASRDETVALAVDEVVDIVDAHLALDMTSDDPAVLGSAVIDGQATEVIDVSYLLYERYGGRSGPPRAGKGGRVLIVDDSPFFRNMLTPLLDRAGYDVTSAASVDEALSLRDAGEPFDLILSDIEMPGKNGMDFARAIRAGGEWTKLPLLALSSPAEQDDMDAGLLAGFDRYVTKLDRRRLLALVDSSMSRKDKAA
jgi:two-component system chemotaxis sensor kinase CheA|tara:strand:+ start:88516 stop:90981 length:2466 start_codon:yes stop_codon:yes gene_type:complete